MLASTNLPRQELTWAPRCSRNHPQPNNQKTLLKEYVNSVSNSPALKSYINQEVKSVKRDLTKYSKKVEDKAVAIKLNETKSMIKPLCKKSFVHDDNVINLLNYYELINELKTIHG